MKTKSRLLAYAVVILLAGYFYSDYAKASEDLVDPSVTCKTSVDYEILEKCTQGSIVWVRSQSSVPFVCDWRYQAVVVPDVDHTVTTYCVYRGNERRIER